MTRLARVVFSLGYPLLGGLCACFQPSAFVLPDASPDTAGDDAARDAPAGLPDTSDASGALVVMDAPSGMEDTGAPDVPTSPGDSPAATTDGPAPALDVAPTCVPAPGGEDCFNGKDDDCNDLVDCQDSSCEAIAVCVPEAPGFEIGVMVGLGEACPIGYSESVSRLNRGLMIDQSCGGCDGCSVTEPTCTPDLRVYLGSVEECEADTAGTGGLSVPPITICNDVPRTEYGKNYGVRLKPMYPQDSCQPNAVAGTVAAVRWQSSVKFCRSARNGAGCGSQSRCVARSDRSVCAVEAGNVLPPPGYPIAIIHYSGVADDRVCSCSCDTSGASCVGITVNFFRSYTCDGNYFEYTVSQGSRVCQLIDYGAVAELQGAPTKGTCTGKGTVSGTVVPTGPYTVACRQ